MVAAYTSKKWQKRREERERLSALKYTGKQILAPGHKNSKRREFLCSSHGTTKRTTCFYEPGRLGWHLRVTGSGMAADPMWGLPAFPGSTIHSLIPPMSARYDYQVEKRNQEAIGNGLHSNPGSRFYNVIVGMISQLAHSDPQAIIPLLTRLHTPPLTHTLMLSHILSAGWDGKKSDRLSLSSSYSSC